MGKLYRGCCKIIFFFKALLAFLAGIALMGYQGYKVINQYSPAPPPLPPVTFPVIGAIDASKCYFQDTVRARLEPPPNAFFFGYSIQWDRDLPSRLASRMNQAPSLVKFN